MIPEVHQVISSSTEKNLTDGLRKKCFQVVYNEGVAFRLEVVKRLMDALNRIEGLYNHELSSQDPNDVHMVLGASTLCQKRFATYLESRGGLRERRFGGYSFMDVTTILEMFQKGLSDTPRDKILLEYPIDVFPEATKLAAMIMDRFRIPRKTRLSDIKTQFYCSCNKPEWTYSESYASLDQLVTHIFWEKRLHRALSQAAAKYNSDASNADQAHIPIMADDRHSLDSKSFCVKRKCRYLKLADAPELKCPMEEYECDTFMCALCWELKQYNESLDDADPDFDDYLEEYQDEEAFKYHMQMIHGRPATNADVVAVDIERDQLIPHFVGIVPVRTG
ncbi:hypothetical protein K474DRAFT_1705854 [Panus rudis PR-1116 ss-1]|nr:hypothetical protein K474DRAFT_1705854 [Panus rudis PR-1116 ss-1]